ncbi:MAG: hemerythrin domain-containing protein [Antricoccus sp.]
MTTTSDLPLADTTDISGIHRVFRQALAAAPRLVGGARPGDADRAEVVGTYYDNVLRLLDSHHTGEDELLTPKLLQRCPEEAETIAAIFAQHAVVHHAIDQAHTWVRTWRAEPTAANAAELQVVLASLDTALTVHLDQEETTVLPIAARCINVAEWGELPADGMRTFTRDKQWLIRGLISDEMTRAQRAEMDAHTPPAVATMWVEGGHAAYTEFLAQLQETAPYPEPDRAVTTG